MARLDERGPFKVVDLDNGGGVVVESLHAGDAFAAARDRGIGFIVDRDGNLIEDRKREVRR